MMVGEGLGARLLRGWSSGDERELRKEEMLSFLPGSFAGSRFA
jgi:hypothetical protein